MKTTKQTFLVVCLLLFGMGSGAVYADFQAGLDAANRGDFSTALREWKPLAEAGNASAQFNLGQIYYKGLRVLKNYKVAVKWYGKAAQQGYASAQYNLVMYSKGIGVNPDWRASFIWWNIAASSGDWRVERGDTETSPIYIQSEKTWYEKAAQQGDAFAQSNLGFMYANGQGVLQDYVRAHMWVNISASSGNENAAEYRDRVAKKMTASQVEKAQQLAKECVAKNYKGC